MLNIAIIGITGKMGQTLAKLIINDPNMQLTAGITSPTSPFLEKDIGSFLFLNKLNIDIKDHIQDESIDVIIDFSLPSALDMILKANKPCVIGTTGYSKDDLNKIKQKATEIPIFHTPNFSFGDAVLKKLSKEAAILLKDADIDIIEAHHIEKKDKPSGTAALLKDTLEKITKKKISIHSIRAGKIIEENKILFNTPEDKLEIYYQANTRDVFAKGAIKAANFIINKPAGLYCMENLL